MNHRDETEESKHTFVLDKLCKKEALGVLWGDAHHSAGPPAWGHPSCGEGFELATLREAVGNLEGIEAFLSKLLHLVHPHLWLKRAGNHFLPSADERQSTCNSRTGLAYPRGALNFNLQSEGAGVAWRHSSSRSAKGFVLLGPSTLNLSPTSRPSNFGGFWSQYRTSMLFKKQKKIKKNKIK